MDLCAKFGNSLMEERSVDTEEDKDESDGNDEDIWKERKLEWR